MSRNIDLARVVVILLFAMTFALIGWYTPAFYASHVPKDNVMVVNEFTAQNTTTGTEMHYMCMDRTVYQPSSATVISELYLANGAGEEIELQSNTMDRYLQEGSVNAVIPSELPDHIQPGEYKYVLVVRMDMANGRVERNFAYESDTFTIENGSAIDHEPRACR